MCRHAALIACGVIFAACYAADLLVSPQYLSVSEFSLLGLLAVVLVTTAVRRHARGDCGHRSFLFPALSRFLPGSRPNRQVRTASRGPVTGKPTKGNTCEH
jgi:hypothetical protein